MRRQATIAAVVLTTLLPVAAALGLPTVRLAGDDHYLWAMTQEDNTLRVRVRVNNRWTETAYVNGQVAVAACFRGELHVFFVGGGYQYFDPQAEGNQPGPWPEEWRGKPILAATSGGPGAERRGDLPDAGAGGAAARHNPCRQRAGVQPGFRTDGISPGGLVESGGQGLRAGIDLRAAGQGTIRRPVIYYMQANEWIRLTDVPVGLLPSTTVYHVTAAADGLYVLACTADGVPVRLMRYAAGQWDELALPPWSLRAGRIGWLIRVGGDLAMVGVGPTSSPAASAATTTTAVEAEPETSSGPAASALFLRLLEGGRLAPPVWVRRGGQPLTLGADAGASVTAHGALLAVAWRDGQDWKLGSFGLDGKLIDVSGLTFLTPQPSNDAESWILLWGPFFLGVGMLLVLILRARSGKESPFALPPNLTPANWGLRLVAFLIDFLPFWFLAARLTGLPELTWDQFQAMLQQAQQTGKAPDAIPTVRTMVVASVPFMVYAIVMEKLAGATVAKLIFQMRVVGPAGRPATWQGILIRNLAKPVELMAQWLLPLFLVLPLFSRYRQRVGDALARTTVISRRQRPDALLVEPPAEPPRDDSQPPDPDDKRDQE